MALNDALKQLVDEVDEAVACAVMDLGSNQLLGTFHCVPGMSQDFFDALLKSSVDIFRGRTISTIEKVMASKRGTVTARSLMEVQVTSVSSYHFMKIVEGRPDTLLVLITDRAASLGTGWATVRRASEELVPLCTLQVPASLASLSSA